MKKRVILLLCPFLIIALICGFSTFVNADILFQDDFEQGMSNEWVSKMPEQWVEDGWLHNKDTDGWPRDAMAVVHDSDVDWTNYTLSLTVDPLENTSPWTYANILLRTDNFLRSSGPSSGRAYQLEIRGGGWDPTLINRVMLSRLNFSETPSWQLLAENYPYTVPVGPMDVFVSIEGEHIQVWIDDILVIDVEDPNPFPFGGIGVHNTFESEARYDNIIVESINSDPLPNAGPNLTILSEDQYFTILHGTATDPDNDTLSYRWVEGATELSQWQNVVPSGEAYLDLSTVPYFSIGQHTLTLEVDDGMVISTDEMILTIENSAPIPAPTGGGVYQINTDVVLGGQVSDFDGDSVIYEWLEGDTVLFSGEVQTSSGGDPVNLPNHTINDLSLGIHILSLRVDDRVNSQVMNDITVEIIDTTAPTLAPVPNKTILWPPNHAMVDVTIEANASDNSGGIVTLSATCVSNEPEDGLGDGDMTPDFTEPVIDQENGIITLQLRAERSGSGDGRIYTIMFTATDDSGNYSQAAIEIIVPHDKKKK